ncbi:MAG: ATP cone domain-containing protein, partial [Candidatus Omnitrophica bacterium]|nr:ATP cone domain-containing protein [Candidatus Omnitrophota bacterium]
MSSQKSSFVDMKVQKRNGQTVPFNSTRISNAIANAFKEKFRLPREAELPTREQEEISQLTMKVIHVLKDRQSKQYFTVEEIQDEVIRQLYENGYKDIGEVYADYRKQHTARRASFEAYSIIKREGRMVSFKPEKITMAIAKALRAHYGEEGVIDNLLEKANQISELAIADIRKQWPQGKALHIEEIQDIVEKTLMTAGLHAVAKRYILYREQRAKLRQTEAQAQLDISFDCIKEIRIKNALGELTPINLNELRFNIETCCQSLENVSADKIFKEALKNFYDGMSDEDICAANIMATKSLLEMEPNYAFVAARILLLKEYQEAIGHHVSF